MRLWFRYLFAGVLILALSILLALNFGAANITLFSGDSALQSLIIWETRLPRILLGAATGALLATSGATLQTLLHNPLADPYIIGVSGGAALGSALALICGAPFWGVMLASFLSSIATLTILWRATLRDAQRLILSGVVLNAFAFALLMALYTLIDAQQAQALLGLLTGTLAYANFAVALPLAVIAVIGVIALLRAHRSLDALCMGDIAAQSLGVNPQRARQHLLLLCAFLVAASVASSGLIGFVGLLIPHAARAIGGVQHRSVLLISALLGASALVIADSISRSASLLSHVGTELPVGIVLALIGAPCMFWVLQKCR